MAIREITVERHWICSRRLRERRRVLGLTQADVVARLGDTGVTLTNRALSTMEHGRGLDLCWLPELADALDCTVTYLLGLTDDPRRWEPDPPPPAPAPGSTAPPAPAPGPTGPPPVGHRNWILGPDTSGPLPRTGPAVVPPVPDGPR